MPSSVQANAPGLSGLNRNPDQPASDFAEGCYRGERVVEIDPASLLQDAAEELTFQFGEAEEKALAKRTIEEEKSRQDRPLIENVQQAMEMLGDLPKSELDRVLQLLQQMRSTDALALRNQVREQLPEPGHQYAALLALAEALREQGAPAEEIQAAEAALQQLLQEEGPAVRAALNISGVAARFASPQLGDMQALRETYRDAVLDYQDLAQTFAQLIDRYGEAELPQAIRYLVNALGADLAADGASIDRSKLNAALNDLYRLEVLTGLLEDCDTLVTRNRASDNAFRGSQLLKEVLELQMNPWLRPELITPLLAKLGVRDVIKAIHALREFKELARLIPLKAYPDPEQRPRLLDAIQLALDAAIQREEEEEPG